MIELLMMPDTPINLRQEPNGEHLFEIPTTLSALGGLSKDLQDLPLKQIVARSDNILSELETQLPVILPQFADLGKKLNDFTDNSLPQTEQV